ncbi:MAG: PstS family phosphate ABC transporter substrate-binding protein [Actinobacteria bacterium]|nr:PstS family phosphate ABC transporter substrate-binding protein [Actinomycetota bacterium]
MTLRRSVARAAVACAATLALAACGGQQTGSAGGGGGQVLIDGSSTVAPLSSAAAELFQQENPGVNVPVATSGTGGGFEKFCNGATDISNASRPIGEDEMAACRRSGIQYTELQVANDALTVVVNPANDWANCLTVEELNRIWSPESEGQVTNWNQVRPEFPDVPLALFGPGTDSGTFDYFTEAVNGEEGASRTDYAASEDDNVLVQGVQGAPGATSYFGFTYFEENQGNLKAIQVDGGEGCTAPSAQAVQDGTYQPLARPLFIYVNNESFIQKPQVAEFVRFYAQQVDEITEAAQYVQLNEEQKAELQSNVESIGGSGG